MIPELGHYALFLAICLAAVQVILPLRGVVTGNIAYMQLSRYTAWGQFGLVGLAMASSGICIFNQ